MMTNLRQLTAETLSPTMKTKLRSPVVPRSRVDPTMSSKPVRKMARDIEDRYYRIKLELKALFDRQLTGRQREGNTYQWHFLCHQSGDLPTFYAVNASDYVYDLSAVQLSELLNQVQTVLDNHLLDGGEHNLWASTYVAVEFQRGTLEAFNNLARQSDIYAQQTSLAQLLSTPAYQNQISAASVATYSEWKGLSDAARADLSGVITDAVARGVNPKETARVISKRLDVSMSRAKNIAQTEQVGALRLAQRNETEWTRDRLGLNTAMLWISALLPTTRPWHASRHGQTYSPEEVTDFYSVRGNRYRCYCSQIPVILDAKGQVVNQGLTDKLKEEEKRWRESI